MSDDNKMAHDPLADLDVMGRSTDALEGVVETQEQEVTDNNDNEAFDIGSSLTIGDVSEMHTKLRELLDSGGDISLSVGNLEQVDAAGLQLLVLLVKESTERSSAILWVGESKSLTQMAAYAGLTDILHLDNK